MKKRPRPAARERVKRGPFWGGKSLKDALLRMLSLAEGFMYSGNKASLCQFPDLHTPFLLLGKLVLICTQKNVHRHRRFLCWRFFVIFRSFISFGAELKLLLVWKLIYHSSTGRVNCKTRGGNKNKK